MLAVLIPLQAAVTSLDTLKTVFTAVVQWVIEFVGLIASEPMLLIGLAVAVVSTIIGIAFRAIRGRGKTRT